MPEPALHPRRRRRVGRWSRAVAVALVVWPPLAWAAAKALITESDLKSADALVVLAGSSTYRERAGLAAGLFREGRAPLILLTDDGQQAGWSAAEQRNPPFYDLAAQELQRRGVPPERIRVIPRRVSSTYEEAVRVREYAETNGLRSVLVVTVAYQSRRALWALRRVFRGSGLTLGLVAPPPGEQSPLPLTWWCYKIGWELVPGEYLKLIYYAARYR
ncbi:MAG: YdcF family protein [Acidobacteria bacterium]|nr:YdcF family protein [Acidobacteriota bacterium]